MDIHITKADFARFTKPVRDAFLRNAFHREEDTDSLMLRFSPEGSLSLIAEIAEERTELVF